MSDADRTNTSPPLSGSADPEGGDVVLPVEPPAGPAAAAPQVPLFPAHAGPYARVADDGGEVSGATEAVWRAPYTQTDSLWAEDAVVAPAEPPTFERHDVPAALFAADEPEADAASDVLNGAVSWTDATSDTAPAETVTETPPGDQPRAMLPAGPGLTALPAAHILAEEAAGEAGAVPGAPATAPVAPDSPSAPAEDLPATRAREARRPWWRLGIDAALVIAAGVLIAIGAQQLLVQPFEVPSTSMLPTLRIGDRILVDRLAYVWGRPVPGDVVVFDSPTEPGQVLVKRVIAVSGQEVNVRNGTVIVDDVRIAEPYLLHAKLDRSSLPSTLSIPAGKVFLMGDNRTNSQDSRTFGPQPVSRLVGRAFTIYWPFARAKGL